MEEELKVAEMEAAIDWESYIRNAAYEDAKTNAADATYYYRQDYDAYCAARDAFIGGPPATSSTTPPQRLRESPQSPGEDR